jgi:hypothetical protein
MVYFTLDDSPQPDFEWPPLRIKRTQTAMVVLRQLKENLLTELLDFVRTGMRPTAVT